VIGTWSDPVDGRSVAHSWKKGICAVDVHERFRTEGLDVPLSGKRVSTPSVFRRVYPYSPPLEKYRKEGLSSEELFLLCGSDGGWWRLKSPTISVGKETSGRAKVGETVLSACVAPHTR